MLHRLRRHPFPVQAYFDHCLVLTYAVPEDAVAPLLPPGLRLDARDGLGFLAIALVQTRALRPDGLPRAFGQDFFLSGYRLFTRLRTAGGRNLRGLRILRSDTDKRRMAWAGNLFTHYRYRHCRAEVGVDGDIMTVRVTTRDAAADLDVVADLREASAPPAGSPFQNLREARQYAGPLPFTFDYEAATGGMVIIEGKRPSWDPKPVAVDVRRCTFIERFPGAVLANAFHVSGVPYRWERGVVEKVTG